jgi:hypothetical protein
MTLPRGLKSDYRDVVRVGPKYLKPSSSVLASLVPSDRAAGVPDAGRAKSVRQRVFDFVENGCEGRCPFSPFALVRTQHHHEV